jgi:hypothetical protein
MGGGWEPEHLIFLLSFVSCSPTSLQWSNLANIQPRFHQFSWNEVVKSVILGSLLIQHSSKVFSPPRYVTGIRLFEV